MKKSFRKSYFLTGNLKFMLISLLNCLEPLKGDLSESGYIINEDKNIPLFDKSNPIISSADIVKYFLTKKDIKKIINSYLLNPRLDQIRILESPLISNSYQSEWHHDSCGHRIKVYIGLDKEISELVFTEIIPKTQNNIYFDYCNTRLIPTQEELSLNRVKINLRHGQIFIFDTNMIHRGIYSKIMTRNVIEIEYSAFIRGILLPGKIGRKKGARIGNLLDNKLFISEMENRKLHN